MPPIDLQLSHKVIETRKSTLQLVEFRLVDIVLKAACPFQPLLGRWPRQLRRCSLIGNLH